MTSLIIILNLVILESLLSIDNAAVLAVMVGDLPEKQRAKALKYGIFGAFFFRGICLLLAAFLIKVLWLKIAGGAYLMYLAISHFTPAKDSMEEGVDKSSNWVYRKASRWIGPFWSTVILVEIMDLAFSLDNVFAAVAMTDNLYLIMIGVFIGILAMRFVAQWFVVLMQKYPSLEVSAFIVIGILGLKLVTCGIIDYIPSMSSTRELLNSHVTDMVFSGLMMLIFFIPLIRFNTNPG